jgi:hypothetical protein
MFDDQSLPQSLFPITSLPIAYIATIGFYKNSAIFTEVPNGFNYINYGTTIATANIDLLGIYDLEGWFAFESSNKLVLNFNRIGFSYYLFNVDDPTLYGYSSVPTKEELSLQMHLTKNASPDSGYQDWNVIQYNDQIAIFYPGNDPRADEVIEIL